MKKNNLGLYIHIPFCNSKCAYCDFVSFVDTKDVQRDYVGALLREIEGEAQILRQAQDDIERTKDERIIDTIFIGGGTPSSLYRGGLSDIVDCVRKNFRISGDLEFSIEANPESCDEEFIKECVEIGVNRLSLGLQSSHAHVLNGIRKHSFEDFVKAVHLAKNYGITSVCADLMLGLPNQSVSDAANSVDELVKMGIGHISMYGLKVEDGTDLQKLGYKVDEEESSLMYELLYERLKGVGYFRYEVSNFAKKGQECRHNKKYWNLEEYLGVGLSASSLIGGRRKTNTSDLGEYIRGNYFGDEEASDFVTEKIMLGLRTGEGVELKYIDKNNKKLGAFIENGMVFIEDNRLKIADKYFYIMNSIISELI